MEDLPKVKTKSKKRVGRGYGSGKGGHTVGRGSKGQKSRSSVHVLFEGMKTKKSLLRRLPLKRGKDKFKSGGGPIVVNLTYLNVMRDGSKVDVESLAKAGVIKLSEGKLYGVKILGGGEINKKLSVALPVSSSAARKIENSGGKIIK